MRVYEHCMGASEGSLPQPAAACCSCPLNAECSAGGARQVCGVGRLDQQHGEGERHAVRLPRAGPRVGLLTGAKPMPIAPIDARGHARQEPTRRRSLGKSVLQFMFHFVSFHFISFHFVSFHFTSFRLFHFIYLPTGSIINYN